MQIFCPEHVQQVAADPQVTEPQTCPVPPPLPPDPPPPLDPPLPPLPPEHEPHPSEVTSLTHELSHLVEQQ
jgi:hypothetical protein